MLKRQKVFIYISTVEDLEATLMMKRRITNEMPFWSFLHVLVEYEEGNLQSFINSAFYKIKERIQINAGVMNVLDISSQGDLWATIVCNNTSFVTNDVHCIESNVFHYEHLKQLNSNKNLIEFLSIYPTYEHVKIRQNQLNSIIYN